MSCDIEIKGSVVRFLNNLLAGFGDVSQRLSIRHEIMAVGLDDTFSPILEAIAEGNSMVFTGEISILCKNNDLPAPNKFQTKFSGHVSTLFNSANLNAPNKIDPMKGVMSGACIAVKNRSDATSKLANVFGSKQTKHRWYSLSSETGLSWFEGKTAPPIGMAPRGSVSVASFVEIRMSSSDSILNKFSEFCFEVYTRPFRCMILKQAFILQNTRNFFSFFKARNHRTNIFHGLRQCGRQRELDFGSEHLSQHCRDEEKQVPPLLGYFSR